MLAASLVGAALLLLGPGCGEPATLGAECENPLNPDCGRGTYCLADPRHGCQSIFQGTCELRPTSCPDIDEPVCGCDSSGPAGLGEEAGYGQRFRNECEARRAGYHWPVAPCVADTED